MDERLKKLKSESKKAPFPNLQFTESNRKEVLKRIKMEDRQHELLLAILQLLNKKRTGYELMELLRARGFQNFEQKEGFLYTLLHRLEQKNYIDTEWKDEERKYYVIDRKGKKLLSKLEVNDYPPCKITELLEWVSLI